MHVYLIIIIIIIKFLFKIFTKIFTTLILEVTQLIMKLTAGSDYTMAQAQ